MCVLTSCLCCCNLQARFVPPQGLVAALEKTVPFLQQCGGGTSQVAHLLSKVTPDGWVVLYATPDLDEDGLPQRAVLALLVPQLGGMVAAKRFRLRSALDLGAFLSELRWCGALRSNG